MNTIARPNAPNAFRSDVDRSVQLIPEEVIDPIHSDGSCWSACRANLFAETEQVAFMTQNVQLGIDFSNDPLLQGPQLFLSRHPRRWKALRLAETIAVSPS